MPPHSRRWRRRPSTYIWSIASDAAGNIYVAAGAPARVYRITPDGKMTTIFEPQELQVQTLVVAKSGIVYAATAPDGKVYRIASDKKLFCVRGAVSQSNATKASDASSTTSSWSASVYFDPGAKYIWDLALDDTGNLYVATGDHGEIYKVSANGQHSLFFKSDEVHIRVLALDPKGNLIAGSDGSGLVYRISPKGEAFVLYSAPKKEITALAIDSAGNIYAAGAGEKRAGTASPGLNINLAPPAQNAPAIGGGIIISPAPSAPAQPFPSPGTGATGGSEIYRIAPMALPSICGVRTMTWSTLSASINADACSLEPAIAATSSPSTASTISPTSSEQAPARSPLSLPRPAEVCTFPAATWARFLCSAPAPSRKGLTKAMFSMPTSFRAGGAAACAAWATSNSTRAAETWIILTAIGAPGRGSTSPQTRN